MTNQLRPLLFTVFGLALGIGLGLVLGWLVWPTEFTDANPALLEAGYRRDYALMIAAAYAEDGDLAAAQTRVNSLGDDGRSFLLNTLLDMILQQQDETDIRQLTCLANDLGQYSPAMEPYLAACLEPSP